MQSRGMSPRKAAAIGAVVMFANATLFSIGELASFWTTHIPSTSWFWEVYMIAGKVLWGPVVLLNTSFDLPFLPSLNSTAGPDWDRYLMLIAMQTVVWNTIVGAVLGFVFAKTFQRIRSH
jgi:hypothetical protein